MKITKIAWQVAPRNLDALQTLESSLWPGGADFMMIPFYRHPSKLILPVLFARNYLLDSECNERLLSINVEQVV